MRAVVLKKRGKKGLTNCFKFILYLFLPRLPLPHPHGKPGMFFLTVGPPSQWNSSGVFYDEGGFQHKRVYSAINSWGFTVYGNASGSVSNKLQTIVVSVF